MQINIVTIYYALGVALHLASIHEISACDHSQEIDDFQIDVQDHEVDVVSCCLLVLETTIIPILSTPHAHLFRFPL
jgi:hypothetical protein